MLYTNKFILTLKWRECSNLFKQLIKGNVKYTKPLNFLCLFSLFYFILRNYILTQHRWKVLHYLIFTRVQHYVDNWLFNKNINHLFEEVYCGKNKSYWLGIESFHIKPPRYRLEVSVNTNRWERLSRKTVYSMILANNNTKWVSSQLFGCGKVKLGSLGRGHLHPSNVYLWNITSLTCRSHGP